MKEVKVVRKQEKEEWKEEKVIGRKGRKEKGKDGGENRRV